VVLCQHFSRSTVRGWTPGASGSSELHEEKLAPQAANRYLSTGFFFHVITDLRTFQTLMLRGFNCTLLLYRRKRHGFLRSSERRIQSRREHLLNMRPCRQIATDNGFSPRAVLFSTTVKPNHHGIAQIGSPADQRQGARYRLHCSRCPSRSP
jgi:hypothetical protein